MTDTEILNKLIEWSDAETATLQGKRPNDYFSGVSDTHRRLKNQIAMMRNLGPCAILASQLTVLFVVLLLGCSSPYPEWSKATPAQRASGQFTYDDAYMDSDELAKDIEESADTIHKLRVQHGFIKETGK